MKFSGYHYSTDYHSKSLNVDFAKHLQFFLNCQVVLTYFTGNQLFETNKQIQRRFKILNIFLLYYVMIVFFV